MRGGSRRRRWIGPWPTAFARLLSGRTGLSDGIRACAQPARVQTLADQLDAPKIDAVFRKWLRQVPHPFAAAHRAAGYRYPLSMLQTEFALTQVLDRPLTGRVFFER
jgi:hypothetical protein